MRLFHLLSLVCLSIFCLVLSEYSTSLALNADSQNAVAEEEPGMRLAQGKKKKKSKKAPKGTRERFINREASVKKRQRNIDFDAVDISGERKNPFGTLVDQNKSDKDFDLIKIRENWHPEMTESTSSIETGRSK